MKTWKQRAFSPWAFAAIIAVFGIVIGFIACDKDSDDPVLCKCEIKAHLEAGQSCDCGGEDCNCTEKTKPQEATLENLFGEGVCFVKVSGNLTDTEWGSGTTGVSGKVGTALNSAYPAEGRNFKKNQFRGLFRGTSEIIIEKNPVDYTKWKTSADGKIMYLAFGALDNNLKGSISAAVEKMNVPEEGSI
jgi:hypothetical protein